MSILLRRCEPAAKTKLNQSGDVDGGGKGVSLKVDAEAVGKRISLKNMTLNNNRQKINDCLGNPVEIGIAVMWRVVDTAKAVFDVDNYKSTCPSSVTAPAEHRAHLPLRRGSQCGYHRGRGGRRGQPAGLQRGGGVPHQG